MCTVYWGETTDGYVKKSVLIYNSEVRIKNDQSDLNLKLGITNHGVDFLLTF